MMCDPDLDPASELMSCQSELQQAEAVYGAMCAMLWEEYIACLSEAACDDESACQSEAAAIENCAPEIGPICMAYGAKYAECYMAPVEVGGKYCQIGINQATFSYGPQCGAAYEEYFACFSELSCAELEMGMYCQPEQMAIEMACV
jgi:hypothetical protein